MQKPLVYLVLGPVLSGRRALVADLIEGERSAVMISADEADAVFPNSAVVRYRFRKDVNPPAWFLEAEAPQEVDRVFFIADGRLDPVEQIEAFKNWLPASGLELGRILTVVDCKLLMEHPQLLPWFDACIHFSDVVLLNRREGVPNKWMSDFQSRYRDQHLPCLFELVRADRVQNPALILEPQARRMSQVFDLEPGEIVYTGPIESEDGEEEDDEENADDEGDVGLAEEPYFERLNGGRRVKELPEMGKFR